MDKTPYYHYSSSHPLADGEFFHRIAASTSPVIDSTEDGFCVKKPADHDAEQGSLCSVCAGLCSEKLLGFNLEKFSLILGEEMDHHKSYVDLVDSAVKGCPLCRAIWITDRTDHSTGIHHHDEDRGLDYGLSSAQIKCRARISSGYLEDERMQIKFYQEYKENIRNLNVKFEAFAYDEDEAAKYILGRPLGNDPWADVRFRLARAWIKNCKDYHQCQIFEDPAFPSRVIDVGEDPKFTDVSLCSGEQKFGAWVALSHCWGGVDKIVKTEHSNIGQFTESIPFLKLELTFQQAISITRLLNYRYLWIDSLCIIQDSKEDWQKEAPLMDRVYGQADLTLVADCADSSSSGMIFMSSKNPSVTHVKLPFESSKFNINSSFYLRQCLHHRATFRKLPARAWALQEDVLSQRKLHFGIEQMFWNCKGCEHREGYRDEHELSVTLPQGFLGLTNKPKYPLEMGRGGIHRGRPPSLYEVKGGKLDDWRIYWYFVVEDYCERSLTRETDRLQAISSLAKVIAKETNDRYVAGLWAGDLYFGLMWTAGWSERFGTRGLDHVTGLPSWSWVSLLHRQSKGLIRFKIYHPARRRIGIPFEEQKAEFLDIHVTAETKDPFGPICGSSYLEVQGQWVTLESVRKQKYPTPSWHTQDTELSELPDDSDDEVPHELNRIQCYLDFKADSTDLYSPIPNLSLLQVALYKTDRGETQLHILILQPLEQFASHYKRVGVAFLLHDHEPETVKLEWEFKRLKIF